MLAEGHEQLALIRPLSGLGQMMQSLRELGHLSAGARARDILKFRKTGFYGRRTPVSMSAPNMHYVARTEGWNS